MVVVQLEDLANFSHKTNQVDDFKFSIFYPFLQHLGVFSPKAYIFLVLYAIFSKII